MQYISSDTNVWIDFCAINRLSLPFLLPYIFVMENDAIEDELLSPKGLKEDLRNAGLVGIEMTIEEFFLAESYGSRFPKLSKYDRIALAIAKERNIRLLTGDKALRKAAISENVRIIGSIGILDELYEQKCISLDEYKYCLTALQKLNGKEVRLPAGELSKRLENLHDKRTALPTS